MKVSNLEAGGFENPLVAIEGCELMRAALKSPTLRIKREIRISQTTCQKPVEVKYIRTGWGVRMLI